MNKQPNVPPIWYTSDTHFFHANIIKYSKRPFADAEEMNRVLIANWNAAVRPEDTIYHLGDFGLAKRDALQGVLDRLNGTKHLIVGNHDKETVHLEGWASVRDHAEIRDGGQAVILLHYGMRVWNKSHHGSIHLYGHSHGSLPGNSQSLDVGVDCWSYAPTNLERIRERLATLPLYRAQDHHVGTLPLAEAIERP